MSSANSLRRFLAQPLVAFDFVRNSMHSHPKTSNFYMMMTSFFFILFVGNGADKLTTFNGISSKYERFRRANRFYIPYFAADYHFRPAKINQ